MSGVADLFKESRVSNKKGKKIDLKSHCTGKLVGLYFSAHWCPPCRDFTPKLSEFYKKFSVNKNFEIIFISSDNNEESFKEYFKEMPWLSLDYDATNIKNEIASKFSIRGIPTLIFIDGDSGKIHTRNGRSKVMDDPEGINIPWSESQTPPLDTSTMSSKKIILCSLVVIISLMLRWFEKI